MKWNNRFTVLIALILVVASLPVGAQTTSSLNGAATIDGKGLPGVTVTITSPALQGSRTTVTGDNGGYSFQSLPPGKYTVSFELEGMKPVSKTAELQLSQVARADADLKMAGVSEAITVTAAAPSVLESPQVSTNVPKALVDKLPVGRTVLAAALLSPGVNSNGFGNTAAANTAPTQVTISGGPDYDNLIMVNGVVITENIRSQASNLFIEDAVQETTIMTGAVSAEWGRFTGGVINTITKSGGNQFSGSLRDSFTNPRWTRRTPFVSASGVREARPASDTNEVDEATLGGYALKDRLWFFGAGRKAATSISRTTARTNIPYATTSNETRYEGKLTGQVTPKHTVVGSYLTINSVAAGTRFTSNIYDAASLTPRRDPESLISFHYNGILTQNLLLEGQASKRSWKVGVGGGAQTTDLLTGTLVRNGADSNARFNSPTFCGVCDVETRNNDGQNIKANYFLDSKSMGRHTIVGGLERFVEQRHANNHQSGSDFRVNASNVAVVGDFQSAANLTPLTAPDGELYPRFLNRSSTYIRWTDIFALSNTHNNLKTQSAFVNDKIDLTAHWSFNAGLRYDKNHALDANGNLSADDSAISPRLTAIYDIRANGQQRVTASFNRYVSKIVEGPGTAAETLGGPATIDFVYDGPPINPAGTPQSQLIPTHQALQMLFDWFQANGGTSNLNLLRFKKYGVGSASVPGYSSVFEHSLKSPYNDEITLGYGAQIGAHGYVRADYINRNWKNFYASEITQSTPQGTDFLGIHHDIAVIHNTNDIKRKYNGLQLQGQWALKGWNAGATYTYSKLRGNDEGENAASGTVTNTPLASYYPEINGYANRLPVGYLSQDQRHRGRAWLGYTQPFGVFGSVGLSLLHAYDSGTPYGLVGPIDQLGYAGAPNIAHYAGDKIATDPQGAGGNYWFTNRDALRTPTIQHTDLSLTYNLPIWKVELFAKGDVLNMFNRHDLQYPLGSTVTDFNTVNTSVLAGGLKAFNPFTEKPVEGVNYSKIAGLGGARNKDSYQLPRTYRFYLGARF